MPPNPLAHYLYLWETTVVQQAIETAWISASSGGRSSSYWCQQHQVFYNAGTTSHPMKFIGKIKKLSSGFCNPRLPRFV